MRRSPTVTPHERSGRLRGLRKDPWRQGLVGPSSLTLLGDWHGPLDVTRDGVSIGEREVVDGGVVLTEDFSGSHQYVLPEPSGTALVPAGTAWLLALSRRRRSVI